MNAKSASVSVSISLDESNPIALRFRDGVQNRYRSISGQEALTLQKQLGKAINLLGVKVDGRSKRKWKRKHPVKAEPK